MNDKYSKYIGKYVHAGGEINGILGHIVDVKDEYDEVLGWDTWFYIKDEQDGNVSKYDKCELQEVTIGIVYVDLK